MKPTLRYETKLWNQGKQFVAGVDEVGRGALAGPLIVSAVMFPKSMLTRPDLLSKHLRQVNDSKLLTEKKRNSLLPYIKKHAVHWTIGKATVNEINRLGIVEATHMAMRRAIKNIPKVEFVLIDAFYIPNLPKLHKKNQLAVKHGDKHCFSIAAASIVAKVHRDQIMISLSKRHPEYALEKNKGYGTLDHQQAILAHGPRNIHRTQFIKKWTKEDERKTLP